MKKLLMIGMVAGLSVNAVNAAEQNDASSFAIMNDINATVISDKAMSETYGKHFTINLPNGNKVHPSGSNSPVIGHASITGGAGGAVLVGLPNN